MAHRIQWKQIWCPSIHFKYWKLDKIYLVHCFRRAQRAHLRNFLPNAEKTNFHNLSSGLQKCKLHIGDFVDTVLFFLPSFKEFIGQSRLSAHFERGSHKFYIYMRVQQSPILKLTEMLNFATKALQRFDTANPCLIVTWSFLRISQQSDPRTENYQHSSSSNFNFLQGLWKSLPSFNVQSF